MNSIYFEKLSRFDRAAEPVTVSIPFAQGSLPNAARLSIRDGEAVLPSQKRALARWPDGSVKWLLTHIQPDLPGNRDKTLSFTVDPAASAPPAATRVVVSEDAAGVRVETGSLSFLLPRDGFWPVRDVILDGMPLWSAPFTCFHMTTEGATVATTGPVALEVEEAGPLRAVVLVSGRHRRIDGSGYMEFRGRITAYAGKPYIEVEHQFLHTEEAAEINLRSLSLGFIGEDAQGTPQLALGEGYYRTRIQEGNKQLSMDLDAETLLYQSNEHFIDSFYGDFWTDWRDSRGGVALSIHQAH